MTARMMLAAMLSRWKIVIAGAALGLIVALLLWTFGKANYVAKAEVLVTAENPETVEKTNDINPPQFAPGYLETQSDIIRSDRTLDRVAGLLAQNSASQAGTPDQPAASGVEDRRLANRLRAGLSLTTAYPSRVIGIEFSSSDPALSAKIANAFAEAYQSVSLDLQLLPAQQSLAWYQKGIKTTAARLAKAQQQLSNNERLLGVTSSNEEVDGEARRLDSLSQALASAQAAQAAAAARTGGNALPDALLSPVVQRLQSDIAQLSAQRDELAIRAGPNNVEMQQMTSKLASLRAQLAQQRGAVAQSAVVSASQLSRNVRTLEQAVALQKQRVIDSRSHRGAVDAQQQEVNAIGRSLDALVEQQSKASLTGSGEQTNVSLLAYALPPEKPVGLSLFVKLILGIFIGGVLGVLAAVGAETLDQRIRGTEDSERLLGVPSLGGRIGRSANRWPWGLGFNRAEQISEPAFGEPLNDDAVEPGSMHLPALAQIASSSQLPPPDLLSLRNALALRWFDHPEGARSLAIVSPRDEDGRSLMAANLAASFADAGWTTLLIDADLHHGRQREIFAIEDELGLADFLLAPSNPVPWQHVTTNLTVLTAGSRIAASPNLLIGGGLKALFAQARTEFQVIIADTPAAAEWPDFQIIATQAFGALVIVRRGATRIAEATQLIHTCKSFGIRVIGSAFATPR